MTVKKAIEILEDYAKTITDVRESILDPAKSWNSDEDIVKRAAKLIADLFETDIIVLNEIKRQIKPKCRHPKKMIDTLSNGQKYCMNCNMDL